MERQVNNLIHPIPDHKIIESVKAFTITSDGLNNLLFLKPFLLESELVKKVYSSPSSLVYLEALDESINMQIGVRRIQVAKAIDEFSQKRATIDK